MKYGFDNEQYREFPPMVYVSIVNICNLKCVHCHYTVFSSRPEWKPKMMDMDIWKRICDEIAEHPWSILNLGTDGEPLAHKQFIDMMRYAKAKGIGPLNITTNGLLLEGERAETIIREGLLDVINISHDAFSEETYKKIRGGDYNRMVRNTHNLIELRNKLNPDVKIQVNMIDQPEAHDEVEAFRAYWEPLVDNVMIRTYYDSTHLTGMPGPDQTGKEKFEKVERWPCQQFWRRITVGEDGTIRFCVDDWYNRSKVSHISEKTIKQVWQGAQYERFRELHLTGQFDQIAFCAKCTEWQGMRWDYDYFVAMEKMMGKKLLNVG